jgi:hypothetical protein
MQPCYYNIKKEITKNGANGFLKTHLNLIKKRKVYKYPLYDYIFCKI